MQPCQSYYPLKTIWIEIVVVQFICTTTDCMRRQKENGWTCMMSSFYIVNLHTVCFEWQANLYLFVYPGSKRLCRQERETSHKHASLKSILLRSNVHFTGTARKGNMLLTNMFSLIFFINTVLLNSSSFPIHRVNQCSESNLCHG